MLDITKKDIVERKAIAQGTINLKASTIEAIKQKNIKKGDVFEISKVASMTAAKQTHLLVPMCHNIPIESLKISYETGKNNITMTCEAKTTAKTGLEMEALIAVSIGLNNIWDMVKYLEKDATGNYPTTSISDIKIVRKEKK